MVKNYEKWGNRNEGYKRILTLFVSKELIHVNLWQNYIHNELECK